MRNKKTMRGLSLIEVLVSFTVLMVGVMPLISMYPALIRVNVRSTGLEEGTKVGMQVIEYIKARGNAFLLNKVDGGYASKTYTLNILTPNTRTYTSSVFEQDFGYPANYFVVNLKQGVAGADLSIYVAMSRAVVDIIDRNGAVVSIDGELASAYYRNFIIGTVIVGTGRKVTVDAAHITGREKETPLQFVVTPIE